MTRTLKKLTAVLLAALLLGILPVYSAAKYLTDAVFEVTYDQSGARQMITQVNNLRQNDAWYYDEDGNTVDLSSLSPLAYDYELEVYAMQRAAELVLRYSHTRPNGEDFTGVYGDNIDNYRALGENIAYGTGDDFADPAAAFEAWEERDCEYNAQGHRRNMLSENFDSIAIAHVIYDGVHYWVQELASPVSSSGITKTDAVDGTKKVTVEYDADNHSLNIPAGDTGGDTPTPAQPLVLCEHRHTRDTAAIAPTCSERGFTAGVFCDDCGVYVSGHKVVSANTSHNIQKKQAGDYTYYVCDVCGRYYSDTSGKTQVSPADVNIEIAKATAERTDGGDLYSINCTWDYYSDGTLVLSGRGSMLFGSSVFDEGPYLKLKDSIKKAIIKGFSDVQKYAFYEFENLETVVLDNTVEYLTGGPIFAYCTNLKQINFPDSLKAIGDTWSDHQGLFQACKSLENVRLNEGLTYIQEAAFYDSGVKNIYLPSTLTYIGEDAFAYSTGIESVFIPASVKRIDVFAFHNCTALSEIVLEDATALDYMAAQVFDGTAFYDNDTHWRNDILYLDTILIRAGKEDEQNYSYKPFYPVSNDLVIPDGVTMLAECAFHGCSNITSVKLPESLTTMCDSAFYYCNSLSEINIPSKVDSIGEDTFRRCAFTEFTIPGTVKTIGDGVFDDCTSLEKVVIEEGCETICSNVFWDCESLSEIKIPKSVKYIGGRIFLNCTALTSITIPEGVETLYGDIFNGCTNLETINILSNPVIEQTYYDSERTFFDDTKWYQNQPNGLVYIGDICLGYKGDMGEIESIKFKKGTKQIAAGAFYANSTIKSIDLPDGLEIIGSGAFAGDFVYDVPSALEAVHIPESVRIIGDSAFEAGGNIKEVTFPKEMEVIGEDAFKSCNSLTSVTLPEKLGTLGSSCFYMCRNLTDVVMPKTVQTIGENAFSITPWGRETRYCDNILYNYTTYFGSQLVFEQGMRAISDCVFQSFYDYSSGIYWGPSSYTLESVETMWLPKTVEYIGEYNFNDFRSLTDIYYEGSEEDWDKIEIADANDILTKDLVRFNHKHTPTEGSAQRLNEAKAAGKSVVTLCCECGYAWDEEITCAATGHKWDNGKITAEPTYEKDGVKTFTCSVCKATKAEKVPKLVKTYTSGDIDGDGKISAADARLALRRSVGLENYKEGSDAFLACDVDFDGKVSAADARLILRASVGLEDPTLWKKA